jgi:hypothetical protein
MTIRDATHADREDARLRNARLEFAQRVLAWWEDNGLSSTAVERLSLAASGRKRINSNQQNKLRRFVQDRYEWCPEPSWLVAIAELNELVADLAAGAPAPPKFETALCAALQPLRNEQGDPMDLTDFVLAFYGLTAWPERMIANREELQALTGRLAELIERVAIAAGRSLLTDLDDLLAQYPDDRERLRAIIYRQAVPSLEELDKLLPAICYALSAFTGQRWDRTRLFELLGNGNGLAVQVS